MNNNLNHAPTGAIPDMLPVIPTVDVVVFPNMIVPLLVLDEKIINGINQSLEKSKLAFLLAAKGSVDNQDAIGTNDLYQIGCVATIMRVIKIPEGGIKVLVQGVSKGRVCELIACQDMLHAKVEPMPSPEIDDEALVPILRNIKAVAEKMNATGYGFSPDFHIILSKMQEPEKIADFILSHITLGVQESQQLLEINDLSVIFEYLYHYLNKEIEVAEIQERIKSNARESMNRAQKEFYLREQLKAIKQELGEDDLEEIEVMREKLQMLPVNDEVKTEIVRQLNRLERTAPDSLEATVTRNYLEWVFALPWNVYTEDNLDISHAKAILDQDHYGLKEVKDRILDFISIKNLKNDGSTPILCFVGPPGTGKTSLGQSIAKCLGRKYARLALGGVKDEAEIRGHRRTYVGAMPGRFIQAMRKAESMNPLVIIDELDKIGADFRGDPSAAMLEVFDPQQNYSFYDNYLGLPFDLSKVMFIATANTIDTISEPLRDRMEIVELSGYTIEEKVSICQSHIIRRAVSDSGLDGRDITIPEEVIQALVCDYTRESGVRQIERLMRKLCSKLARNLVEKNELNPVTLGEVERLLGPKKFMDEDTVFKDQIGISNGLAWTSFGGEIIKIEAVLMPGKGKLMLTGQLGDVMKESAQAAVSYARSHAQEFGIPHSIFTSNDLHIHIPAGAIPKDGPSAGITMLAAILSALTNRPICADYAMTGELNLRGEVMPIGGLKEKVLAAKRNKLHYVIAPIKNKNDLMGMEDMIKGIDIVWVQHANEVLDRVLLPTVAKKRIRSR